MKKLLSVLMALAMVAVLMVPVFAVELNKDNTSGDVIIKTVTVDEFGNDIARKYIVTIPADTEIAWGTESTDLVYSVESHLGDQEFVKVTVTGNDKMIYSASQDYELAYALDGTTVFQATVPTIYPAADQTFTVNIAADDWNTAVVGDYADTLTFTAEVV